jgi:hypothetical protein
VHHFWGMGKEKTKEKKAAASMFIDQFMDAKTIAEILNIEPNTVGDWRKKGKWDDEREQTINNPVKMRSLLAKQMLLIADGKDATINADALAKIFKVYEGLADKINPGIVSAILKLYDEWLAKENPQLAISNLEYNKKFLIHIINTYG